VDTSNAITSPARNNDPILDPTWSARNLSYHHGPPQNWRWCRYSRQ